MQSTILDFCSLIRISELNARKYSRSKNLKNLLAFSSLIRIFVRKKGTMKYRIKIKMLRFTARFGVFTKNT